MLWARCRTEDPACPRVITPGVGAAMFSNQRPGRMRPTGCLRLLIAGLGSAAALTQRAEGEESWMCEDKPV